MRPTARDRPAHARSVAATHAVAAARLRPRFALIRAGVAAVHTVFVDVPEETTVHAIEAGLARAERRTRGGVVNLVVPMAGEGSRFRKAG